MRCCCCVVTFVVICCCCLLRLICYVCYAFAVAFVLQLVVTFVCVGLRLLHLRYVVAHAFYVVALLPVAFAFVTLRLITFDFIVCPRAQAEGGREPTPPSLGCDGATRRPLPAGLPLSVSLVGEPPGRRLEAEGGGRAG